jgi:UDP-glucuronate 4-epimerase
MKILITGAAGFIGYHLALKLIARGDQVVGLDNINDYYDPNLKLGRLAEAGIDITNIKYNVQLVSNSNTLYKFVKLDLVDRENLNAFVHNEKFDAICHLAAQAGVRYSLINPQAYIDSNIQGFLNILECSRTNKIKHLVYASSSSVYGLNKKMPFSIHNNVDHPISLYAATKKSNELMAHSYSHLYNIPTTGLRFFTVYGPWGRPDMALFIFVKSIIEGKPIQVFNMGNMRRDFTYIEVIDQPAIGKNDWDGHTPDPASSTSPYRIFNIGNGNAVNLLEFITAIEDNLGKKAIQELLPIQDGDVEATWADITEMKDLFNFKPKIPVLEGVRNFVEWYRGFYKI